MRIWVHRHGRLLGRIALSSVIAAVVAPVVGILLSIPYLFGGEPYPPISPGDIAFAVGVFLAVVGTGAGLAVWITRAPGYELGIAAVLVIGALTFIVGSMLLTGYLMSIAHTQVGS